MSAAYGWPGFQNQTPDQAATVPGISAEPSNQVSSPPHSFQLELAPRLGVALPLSLGLPERFLSGFTSETTIPTGMPSRIARPSLSARTFTSCISNPRPRSQYT